MVQLKRKLGDNMKENRFVSWIRWHPAWSVIIALLFFIVVIPILINLCYSCDHAFYVTQWDARDVLSYYSTLLGAAIAAISLIVTIRFTRKQIERENYIRSETEKWKGAEHVIDQALTDIDPLNMCVPLDGSEKLSQIILRTIQSEHNYSIKAQSSLDKVKLYLDPIAYQQVDPLVKAILRSIEDYCNIAHEFSLPYENMLACWNDNEVLPSKEKFIQSNNSRIVSGKIADAHAGSFQNLLNLKRETFYRIYQSINATADQKLELFNGSVDKCQPSNGSEKVR